MKRRKQIIIGSALPCVCAQFAHGQSRFDTLTTSLQQMVKKDSLTGISVAPLVTSLTKIRSKIRKKEPFFDKKNGSFTCGP